MSQKNNYPDISKLPKKGNLRFPPTTYGQRRQRHSSRDKFRLRLRGGFFGRCLR